MHYYEVAPTQIIRTSSAVFTYHHDTLLSVGQIVTIEVGKKTLVGVVIRKLAKPPFDTKPVKEIVEQTPLPFALVELSLWLSSYYVTHLAQVLQTILPRGLQKKRRERSLEHAASHRDRTKNVFTPEQMVALERVEAMSSGTTLLHGVTGSGKTAVYIELIKRVLATGRSAIVLVPEIALTSQLVDELSHHFDNILLTHSRQTEAERHIVWRTGLTSVTPQVVIGPRSALFMPISNVGVLIIDEAHEPSLKQEQSPRYSALRAASVLARHHSAKVILGSATPPVADYYLAKTANHPIITMGNRAKKDARPPIISLIDMTKQQNFKKHRFISDALLAQMEASLATNHQVLIFHNRRGSTSTTLCETCGWSAICPRCFVPLTLHADTHHLRCHVCGLKDKVPTSCPVCHSSAILHKGVGTKLIEAELRKLYPNKIIMRFDGDSKNGFSVEDKYKELYSGEIDIIIGTQVIAKGLDLPKLRLVGIIQADAGLSLPDYSASERTFQLLAQAVGRVGRFSHQTQVVVQSYQPTHPAIVNGLSQNYQAFYDHTIKERGRAIFPPFTFLLKLTCIYKTEAAAVKNTQKLAAELRQKLPSHVQVLGPTPAFYERQHDTYRWQLVLKSPKRASLVDALQFLPPTHWQFELDPHSLL